jgi:hypothetical protein
MFENSEKIVKNRHEHMRHLKGFVTDAVEQARG